MRCKTFREMLPEAPSDEAIYHLVNFVWALAYELDEIYCGEIIRYKAKNLEQNPNPF